MKEIFMEMELLKDKIDSATNEDNSFGKVIYSIINKLTKEELYNMTNEQLIRQIQRAQIIESN